MITLKKVFVFVLLFLSFVAVAFSDANSVVSSWTPPNLISEEKYPKGIHPIYSFVNLKGKTVLLWAVWSEISGSYIENRQDSIVYLSEMQNSFWNPPVDLIVSRDADLYAPIVLQNSDGVYHVVATNKGCLEYLSMPEDSLDLVANWQEGYCIDDFLGMGFDADLDSDGNLYVVYLSRNFQSVKIAVLLNADNSWKYYEIADSSLSDFSEQPFFAWPSICICEDIIHVVWSPAQPPGGYPLLGVLYAQSVDGGSTWSSSINLGENNEGQPSIACYNNYIHVVWNGDARKKGRFYRYSEDNGITWQVKEDLISSKEGHGGLQKRNALIVDNKGTLHVLIHDQDMLYYVNRPLNSSWTSIEPIFDPVLLDSAEVYWTDLSILEGNRLNAFYVVATEDNTTKLYYQQKLIDSIKIIPEQRPSTATTTVENPDEDIISDSQKTTPTSLSRIDEIEFDGYQASTGVFFPIFLGVIPVLLIVLVLIVRRWSDKI